MFATLLLLGHVCHTPELSTTVDMIEVNHSYANGVDQIIFWDWNGGRWEVRAWRLAGQCGRPEPCDRGWRITWLDKGKLRTVYTSQPVAERQTHTPVRIACRSTREI